MSRSFPGSTNTDSIALGTIAPSTQRTMSLWFGLVAFDATPRRMWNYCNDAETAAIDRVWAQSSPNRFTLQIGWDGGPLQIDYTAPTLQEWHHLFVSYDGSSIGNEPIVLLNGATMSGSHSNDPSGNLVTSSQPFQIGNRGDGVRCWNGWLAEVVRWNVILTTKEAAALALGVPPWMIRRTNQVLACPIWGLHSPELDLSPNRRTGTVTGTTRANHPPVIAETGSASPVLEAAAPSPSGAGGALLSRTQNQLVHGGYVCT